MNAKKLEHFLFVPLQPWRHRSDHNRNLGAPYHNTTHGAEGGGGAEEIAMPAALAWPM